MGFFDRLRGRWSLEGVQRPWGDRPSLHAFLRAHTEPQAGRLTADGRELPDEREEPAEKVHWAAGARDGVLGHHMGPSSSDGSRLAVKQLVKALGDLCASATADTLRHLYTLAKRQPVLGLVDELLQALGEHPDLPAPRLHAIAGTLAREAPDREAVKLAISLLGVLRGGDDRELLTELGVHDEFTLFTAVALANQDNDAELSLWHLARRVDGWGRIQVVERLADAQRAEVRAWLLREGFRNSVMNEYLAWTCAMAGGLHTALATDAPDEPLLRGAAGLFVALARGGPAQDLADYPHREAAVGAWLAHLERRFLDLEQLEALDALAGRDELPDDLRARIHLLSASPTIGALIAAGLGSTQLETFGRADRAARLRGIETFATHEALVLAGDPHGYAMFRMMQEATDATIDRALIAAAGRLDLARIATGPANELGLGPAFTAHHLLDSVLQELGRFPGKGQEFLSAGLRSPVVRNRHWALRVLATWGRERWSAPLLEAVTSAAAAEPEQAARVRFARVLAGGPFDDPTMPGS